jgi:hypothetical protein
MVESIIIEEEDIIMEKEDTTIVAEVMGAGGMAEKI